MGVYIPDTVFLYTANVDSDEPIMFIDRFIGFDNEQGFGIMGDMFQRELFALDEMGKSRIQIWINSPGGDVSEGYNIYNAILKTKTKVDTYCYGMAASMAGVIFQGGRTRTMTDYSWLMYHNPYDPEGGTGAESELIKTFTESIAKMIASRCGKSEDEIKKIMKKTSYIMADEALANGLCDKVEKSSDSNKKRAMPTEAKAFWKAAEKIRNQLLPPTNKNLPKMTKVANKLNLNPEASEDSIVTAIDAVQNKISEGEQTIARLNATILNKDSEIDKKKKDLEDKQAECDKLKGELDELKKKQKEADDKAKAKADEDATAKAKNMIEGFVKEGRIKNEATTIASWTAKAKDDPDGVKALIEGLPVNRAGVHIPVPTTDNPAATGSVIFDKMAEVRDRLKI